MVLVDCINKTVTHLDSLFKQSLDDPIIKIVKTGLSKLNVHTFLNENYLTHSLATDCPMQQNGYDCGLFMCLFTRFIVDGLFKFTFDQNDINQFRLHVKNEIISKNLIEFAITTHLIDNNVH